MPPNSEHFPKSIVHWSAVKDTLAITIGKRICLFSLNFSTFMDLKRSQLANNLSEKASIVEATTAINDFCISNDGTALIAVEKRKSVLLWDITDIQSPDGEAKPIIKEPILTLPANQDISYSGVVMIDSALTNGAMRYVLLSYDQNRSFQIWDIDSRSIVQEIHIQQRNNESYCYMEYFSKAGMLVLSDTENNKFMFFHIKYPKVPNSLQNISQAQYLKVARISQEASTELPAIDYNAEYNFLPNNKIISFSLIETTGIPGVLFDIYVGHNNGATIVSVKEVDIALDNWGSAPKHPDVVSSVIDTSLQTADSKQNNKLIVKEKSNSQMPIRKHIISPVATLKAQRSRKFAGSTASSPTAIPSSAEATASAPTDDNMLKEPDNVPKSFEIAAISEKVFSDSSNGQSAPSNTTEEMPINSTVRAIPSSKKKKEILTRKSAAGPVVTEILKKENTNIEDLFERLSVPKLGQAVVKDMPLAADNGTVKGI